MLRGEERRGEKIAGVKCCCQKLRKHSRSDEDKSGSRNRAADYRYSWSVNLDSLSVLFLAFVVGFYSFIVECSFWGHSRKMRRNVG